MIAFIDVHREAYGVEPISKVLPIAPSTYYEHIAQRVEPTRRSARARPLTSPVVAVMEVGTPDTPIDGLLALDALAGRTITIDFARRELVVEPPASLRERIVGTTEVPAHLAREIGGIALSVFVEAPTAKGPIRLELDSGNGGTILVSRPLLKLLGLPDHGTAPQQGRFSVAPALRRRA